MRAQERQRVKGSGKKWRPNQPKGGVAYEARPQILAQTLMGEDFYMNLDVREDKPWEEEQPKDAKDEEQVEWDHSYFSIKDLEERIKILEPLLKANVLLPGTEKQPDDSVKVVTTPTTMMLPARYPLRWKDWLDTPAQQEDDEDSGDDPGEKKTEVEALAQKLSHADISGQEGTDDAMGDKDGHPWIAGEEPGASAADPSSTTNSATTAAAATAPGEDPEEVGWTKKTRLTRRSTSSKVLNPTAGKKTMRTAMKTPRGGLFGS